MPNYVTNRFKIEGTQKQIDEILEYVRPTEGKIGDIDFNKIIPMPESLNMTEGSITKTALDSFLSHLAHSGQTELDSTKYFSAVSSVKRWFWNPNTNLTGAEIKALAENNGMSVEQLLVTGKQYLDNQIEHGAMTWYDWCTKNWGTKWNAGECQLDNGNEIRFDTAWSSPLPIVQAISAKYPAVEIDLHWADEDVGQNVGFAKFQAGKLIDQEIPSPGSKAAYQMAFEILGVSAQDCRLRWNEKDEIYEYDDREESVDYSIPSEKNGVDNLIDSAKVETVKSVDKDDMGKGDLGR